MSTMSIKPETTFIDLPAIRVIAVGRPWTWLRMGWHDFRRAWLYSLPYGILIAALGWALVNWGWKSAHLGLTLTSGFLLVAPFLAVFFHALSRRIEQHQRVGDWHQLMAPVLRNGSSIGLYAVMLAFILSVWERISAILVGVFLKGDFIGGDYFGLANLFTLAQINIVIAYVVVGGLLAALVFALSVVSLPMLLDRRVDVVTATMASLRAARENPLAMMLWAVLIVSLTLVGFVTGFIGLAVIFPVLGHASWHAYRELIEKS